MSDVARTAPVRRDPAQFRRLVLSAVRRIPAGRVATYGDVAAAAGRPRAWRAVGNIMRGCAARDVPCHRVVAAGGRLGGYGGNVELKRALLRAEGVPITGNTIRSFDLRRWFGPGPRGRSAAPAGPAPLSGEPVGDWRRNRRG